MTNEVEEYLGKPTQEEQDKLRRDIQANWDEQLRLASERQPMKNRIPQDIDGEGSMIQDPHTLQEVFDLCIHQLTKGKGSERHGNGKDFIDQPWKHLADVHGYGFLTGQAAKKLEEAQGFDELDRWEREMIGVIVYASMALLYRKMENNLG